ncbi:MULTISPECIES: PaaI family thioesterase [unclassified Janibacter]|uniref:PaaI family thioesterase n=1 Tax=unclassified Janibacter TaxID=2649294 RepID=UPI003D04AA55
MSTQTDFLTSVNANRGALAETMGIELTEVTPERLVGRMPVEGNTQPYGMLHGGASVVLAETLGSVGAALTAGEGRIAVGLDINATHHRAARTGHVTGVATRISGGRSVATYDIVITDDEGQRLCTSRITCLLRDTPPGA